MSSRLFFLALTASSLVACYVPEEECTRAFLGTPECLPYDICSTCLDRDCEEIETDLVGPAGRRYECDGRDRNRNGTEDCIDDLIDAVCRF